ncbi:hypothetical protein TNCV_804871 [Trichonephila clavipes]|nr:hypothetical protein TNCV_804871 [Trichonephila clavipes]
MQHLQPKRWVPSSIGYKYSSSFRNYFSLRMDRTGMSIACPLRSQVLPVASSGVSGRYIPPPRYAKYGIARMKGRGNRGRVRATLTSNYKARSRLVTRYLIILIFVPVTRQTPHPTLLTTIPCQRGDTIHDASSVISGLEPVTQRSRFLKNRTPNSLLMRHRLMIQPKTTK